MTGDPGEAGVQDPMAYGLGRLFYLTAEAIVAADLADERVVLWNPAAEALFGYTVDEALGMRLDRLVPSELRDRHLAGLHRYRGGGAPVLVGGGLVVVAAVTKSGESRDVALTLTDVSEPGGRATVLAVLRDVTAQAVAERQLAAANAALREFVATASHDLRAPLASVLGFAQMLMESPSSFSEEDRTLALESILRAGERASRLVGDLLTLSQIQANVIAVHGEQVNVAAAVDEAIQQSGVTAGAAIARELVAVVDPHHLQRILTNYLTNAERYGAPPIVVEAARTDDVIDLRVCDQGPGVPDGFSERLFTAFAQADPSRREGTGLGLSIVMGLASANGGRAFYERGSSGTCFGVRLPCAAG